MWANAPCVAHSCGLMTLTSMETPMKKILIATSVFLISATAALAAGKTYQVTGPVLELTDSKIVVDKDGEKWELKRDSSTKLPESVKVGSKITAKYSMTATDVEDKSPAPKAEKKADAKAADAKKDEKKAH